MPNRKHYFIEQRADGRYAVRATESERASDILDTQHEAIARVKELNPNDHPDVVWVRNARDRVRDKSRPRSSR
jgi:uncharacterized protein YdaT